MLKDTSIKLFLIGVFVISLLVALYYTSGIKTQGSGGFLRKFGYIKLNKGDYISLKSGSWFLYSFNDPEIILGNYSAPHIILTTEYLLRSSKKDTIKLEGNPKYRIPTFNINFLRNHVTVFDGTAGDIYFAEKGNYIAKKIATNLPEFDAAVSLSSVSFCLRRYEKNYNTNSIKKINISDSSQNTTTNPNTGLNDIFSDDGQLLFNFQTGKILYSYYYKNKILVLDTNLSQRFVINTLDTFSVPKISLDSVHTSGTITFNKPPIIVNKKTTCNNTYLFVQSGIRSDNEKISEYNSNTVLDLYNLNDGRYCCSFYLPNFKELKTGSFLVSDKHIVAVNKNYLVTYKFEHNH